jgi:twitching motility protein PilT
MSIRIENINIPPVLIENLKRNHGIVLFAGNRNSGYEKTFQVISDKIKSLHPNSTGSIVLKDNTSYKDSFWNPISYDDLILRPLDDKSKSSDFFIFENISKAVEFEAALEIAEDGRFVFMHFSCMGIANALHRIFGFYRSTQKEHYLWRFLDEAFLFYSQVEILDENNNSNLAGEIALLTPELKKILFEKGIFSFEEKLKTLNDESGVVTLNQSILQLLIRRKITITKAFEISRDPQDLDILLKKVGI